MRVLQPKYNVSDVVLEVHQFLVDVGDVCVSVDDIRSAMESRFGRGHLASIAEGIHLALKNTDRIGRHLLVDEQNTATIHYYRASSHNVCSYDDGSGDYVWSDSGDIEVDQRDYGRAGVR